MVKKTLKPFVVVCQMKTDRFLTIICENSTYKERKHNLLSTI